MKKQLSKWVTLTCLIVLGLYAAELHGLVSKVLSMDSTGITYSILVLFVLSHFAVVKVCHKYTEGGELQLWFLAESMIALGMIGTVVGFTMLFGEAFQQINIEDTATVMAAIGDIATGMGTALITTLVGLICSLILKGELVFIVENK